MAKLIFSPNATQRVIAYRSLLASIIVGKDYMPEIGLRPSAEDIRPENEIEGLICEQDKIYASRSTIARCS